MQFDPEWNIYFADDEGEMDEESKNMMVQDVVKYFSLKCPKLEGQIQVKMNDEVKIVFKSK